MKHMKVHERSNKDKNHPRDPPKRTVYQYVPHMHPPSPTSDSSHFMDLDHVEVDSRQRQKCSSIDDYSGPASATLPRDPTPDSDDNRHPSDDRTKVKHRTEEKLGRDCTPAIAKGCTQPISPAASGASSTASPEPVTKMNCHEPESDLIKSETTESDKIRPVKRKRSITENSKDRPSQRGEKTSKTPVDLPVSDKQSSAPPAPLKKGVARRKVKTQRSEELPPSRSTPEPKIKAKSNKDNNNKVGSSNIAKKPNNDREGLSGKDSIRSKAKANSRELESKQKADHRFRSERAKEPCINASGVVQENYKVYSILGESLRISDPSVIETLELEYPGDDAREIFPIVIPQRKHEYDPVKDIYATTMMIAEHCLTDDYLGRLGDVKKGIVRSIQRAVHRKSTEDLKAAISIWNEEMRALKTEQAFDECERFGPAASYNMIAHILEQAYSRSVAPSSHLLNQYEGFSSNVYGEVKHNFVNNIIKEANIQPHHVFVDMGSGIGNVVLQVAAQCLCDSYGIEIMDTPAKLAEKQKEEFLSRMRYYAKPCGRITLNHSDFLDDTDMHEVIKKADVIFVNNYAFSAELNQMILAKFLDLKEGAMVISLRSFVPVDRPTARSARRSNAIESIFRAKEYYFARDSVSWMNEGGPFFIHTVDRKQLARMMN